MASAETRAQRAPLPVRPARALLSSLFWGAIGLLLVNDHLLKGRGLLPGAITGKISDFAGLIVAPLVLLGLAGLLAPRRAQGRRLRLALFALPAGIFAAINLSPACAGIFDSVMAALGTPWHTFSDPTDLMALAALPLAWWAVECTRGGPRPWARARAQQRAAHPAAYAGLLIGAALSMASGGTPDVSWFTRVAVFNRSGVDVDLRVRWVESSIDCATVRDHLAASLPLSAFGPGTTYVLRRNATLPLDRGVADAMDGLAAPQCDAALIRAEGLPSTIVFWEDGTNPFASVSTEARGEPGPGELEALLYLRDSVEEDGGVRHVLEPGLFATANLEENADEAGPASCRIDDSAGMDWAVPEGMSYGTVTERYLAADGCTGLSVQDELGTTGTVTLCVPEEDVPFVVGDALAIARRDADSPIGTYWDASITSVREDGSRVGLSLFRDLAYLDQPPYLASPVPRADGCTGGRHECGAFLLPMAVEVQDGVTRVELLPGEALETGGAVGRYSRFRLGGAEHRVAVHPDCAPGRAATGPTMEALVYFEE